MPKALPIVFFLFLMAGVNLFGQGVYKHIKELKIPTIPKLFPGVIFLLYWILLLTVN
jgi:hypothetical protein